MAFQRLDAAGQASLQADLEALWTGANVAEQPTEQTLVKNEYLRVTGCADLRTQQSGFAVVGDGRVGAADLGEAGEDLGVEVGGKLKVFLVGGADEVRAVLFEAFAVHKCLDFLVGFGNAGDVEIAEFDGDGGEIAHVGWMRGGCGETKSFCDELEVRVFGLTRCEIPALVNTSAFIKLMDYG